MYIAKVIENDNIIELDSIIQGFKTKNINPVIDKASILSIAPTLTKKVVNRALIPVGGK